MDPKHNLINLLSFLVKLGLTEINTEPEKEDSEEDGEEDDEEDDDVDENEEDDEKKDEEVHEPQVGLLSFQFIIAGQFN